MPERDEQYEILWRVRRLFRAMTQYADSALADLDATAAERAIMEFLFPDSRLTVPDIAARYRVSRQHVQATANRLIEQGYVETTANPRHKRSPLLSLTAGGRKLFKRIRRREERDLRAAFDPIGPRDRQVTLATLGALLHYFEGDSS